MASYNYVTNASQDADIAAQLTQVNAARVAAGQATWTAGQMILADFGNLLATYAVTRSTVNFNAALDAWRNATPAQRAAAAADLGVTLV